MQEEFQETARDILKQVTVYIDDVTIHMTAHKPNSLIALRMSLAERGLNLLDEEPTLRQTIIGDPTLTRKYTNLRARYSELDLRIGHYKAEEK